MRAWKCKQVVDFDKSTTTMKEEMNRTTTQQNEAKYHFLICLHWHPIGSYSSDDPQEKNLMLSLWADTDKGRTVFKVICELWTVTDSFAEPCV